MNEYVEYLKEMLSSFGSVQARRMFGGYGLFHEGLMFGLVADETLYLKTDEINRPDFVARNLPPFEYNKRGKMIQMSYSLAPAEILEDPEQAKLWASRAFAAAQRAKLPGKTTASKKARRK